MGGPALRGDPLRYLRRSRESGRNGARSWRDRGLDGVVVPVGAQRRVRRHELPGGVDGRAFSRGLRHLRVSGRSRRCRARSAGDRDLDRGRTSDLPQRGFRRDELSCGLGRRPVLHDARHLRRPCHSSRRRSRSCRDCDLHGRLWAADGRRGLRWHQLPRRLGRQPLVLELRHLRCARHTGGDAARRERDSDLDFFWGPALPERGLGRNQLRGGVAGQPIRRGMGSLLRASEHRRRGARPDRACRGHDR